MDLQKMYQEGHLRPGHSEEVDLAITEIINIAHFLQSEAGKPRIKSDVLRYRWSNFLAAVMVSFPDIEPYNLTALNTIMVAQDRHEEELFLCQLIESLVPSSESVCFLGHAYRRLGEDHSALQSYQEAHRRVTSLIEMQALDPTNPAWMDAADYLRYAAQTQIHMDLAADAFMSLIKAYRIVKAAGEYGRFKLPQLNEVYQCLKVKTQWNPVEELT